MELTSKTLPKAKHGSGKVGRKSKYNWGSVNVGQGMLFDNKSDGRSAIVSARAYSYRYQKGLWKFGERTLSPEDWGGNVFGVWRVE